MTTRRGAGLTILGAAMIVTGVVALALSEGLEWIPPLMGLVWMLGPLLILGGLLVGIIGLVNVSMSLLRRHT